MRDDATGRRAGRIVELEAYIGVEDRASHARFGPTPRNRPMFGPPGHAYVYLVYGMYDCLNIVTEPEGRPAAVLVRAVEPLEGHAAMRASRLALTTARRKGAALAHASEITETRGSLADHRLASGPGLVAAAFGIDTRWTGADLCDPDGSLRLEPAPSGEGEPVIRATPRIGIDYAGEPWTSEPWRLIVEGSPSLSGPARFR